MNIGKVFEEDMKKSIPDHVLFYRLPDSAQSFSGGNLRFSLKNPFDYLFWDSKYHNLFAVELKTVHGNSISFERSKDDNAVIHLHQIEGLNKWDKYDGIISGFIIFFRKQERTIFLDIGSFNRITDILTKKSFNLNDLDKYAIPYMEILQEKKRTRYRYDMNSFFERINTKLLRGRNHEKKNKC